MPITLNQLMGLPVVWQGKLMGQVDRAVVDEQASQLMGLIIRRGLAAAKWVPSQGIQVLGPRCVVTSMRPGRLPDELPSPGGRVYLTNGRLMGEISDVLLCEDTLQVVALEVSESLLGRLIGQRRYAAEYHIGFSDSGRAVVAQLLSWTELAERFEEERE